MTVTNKLWCAAIVIISCALHGCSATGEGDELDCAGGKCDGDVDQTCSDTRYDDGVCHTELSCAVPDIDCFRTFTDDAAAAAWFTDFEARYAAARGRAPRKILPSSHPQFAKFRALLDRGWQAMREQRPVGTLAEQRPGLVFIEDPSVNAFVMPEDLDQKRASFAVIVHSGTLAATTTDDAYLGLMMHEIQHAIGLHVVAGVNERILKFYMASPDEEPIGYKQQDDSDLREGVNVWRAMVPEIGSLSNAELRGFPTSGFISEVYFAAAAAGVQANPTGCARSRSLLNTLTQDLNAAVDPVSDGVQLDASFGQRVSDAFDALRDECMPHFSQSFFEVAGGLQGVTGEQFAATMKPDDRALVQGKHVIDAILALVESRRSLMRTIEAQVQQHYGRPWSLVRFYSEEENADDVTVAVLRAAGLEPTGLATFLTDVLMTPAERAACMPVLASGEVPAYGVDLYDTHHSDCWRVHHLRLLANARESAAARTELQPPSTVRPRLPIKSPFRLEMH